jgi:hypothetical protein
MLRAISHANKKSKEEKERSALKEELLKELKVEREFHDIASNTSNSNDSIANPEENKGFMALDANSVDKTFKLLKGSLREIIGYTDKKGRLKK